MISANYGSGSLSVHPVLAERCAGDAVGSVAAHRLRSRSGRQAGPHAHMATFVTDTLVLAVDLGIGRGRGLPARSRRPAGSRRRPCRGRRCLPGFGPRHLVVLPENLVALAGELSGEIALLRLDPETGALTLLDVERASESAVSSAPSGIAATGNGRFVVIANRGPDTVASFAVDHHLGGAHLRPVDEISCGGAHPRAVTVIGDLLYVANQHAGNITVLRIDEQTGDLTDTGSRISTPTPTHVLAAGRSAVTDYRIVRLQVQRSPVKAGKCGGCQFRH